MNKSEEKWIGPYTVVKKSDTGGYTIKDFRNRLFKLNRKDIERMEDVETEDLQLSEEGSMLYSNIFTINGIY
ncbi:hypothetical protein H312_01530 [Anncaliia algerae PRA339]|uniref:Uncharacterized protein n=1 Tax=Anncaliia algerae PRA339 TaxID=1288291 RepID=A0A059F252_9MICR|nr:hypothetical protein H312_01530 [Anncaliia algerae PRA339]